MTVKELVARLQALPQGEEVQVAIIKSNEFTIYSTSENNFTITSSKVVGIYWEYARSLFEEVK